MSRICLRIASCTLLLALLTSARTSASTNEDRASLATTVQSGATPAPPLRTVTDELGRRITVPADVRRIVSLAPSVTEMIYALHIEDRLAGDTDYCDVPEAAKNKPHVGSVLNPSFEAIVALHPDVVIAVAYSGNRKDTVEALQQLGVPVYVINPGTVLRMLDSMIDIAKLAGAGKGADEAVAQLRAQLDDVHAKVSGIPLAHVLFVVQLDPLITVGQHTFIADALQWAGAESIVFSKQDWPQLSLEEVVRLQPDYIVMATSKMGEGARTLADLRSRAVWKDLRCVQLGRVAVVTEEIDRPAPGLVDAIGQLAHQVHADAFGPTHGLNGEARTEPGGLSPVPSMPGWRTCAR